MQWRTPDSSHHQRGTRPSLALHCSCSLHENVCDSLTGDSPNLCLVLSGLSSAPGAIPTAGALFQSCGEREHQALLCGSNISHVAALCVPCSSKRDEASTLQGKETESAVVHVLVLEREFSV